MKNGRNLLKIILGVLVVLFSLLFGFDIYQNQSKLSEVRGIKEVEVEVWRVVDGDTIRVKDIKTGQVFNVRYLGIDTPELDGPDYETCFCSQAKEKNEELVLDRNVVLEFDIDKYDRFFGNLGFLRRISI
ncbi:thermonuclease family protein [Candidatus Parcubacteria bacterium]|nr:thermonuclease family protein [Candidatus Parcubacteria bacterium]